jgi:site-specific DNA-methyltransferase (adenine-specific)
MTWDERIPIEYRDSVTQGDALSLLACLPDGCVDLVLTDPPYSSGGLFRGDRTGDTERKYVNSEQMGNLPSFLGDNRDQRAYGYWCALWLAECLRVTRPGGILCCFTDWRQLPTTTDAIQAGGWVWRGIVPWDKTEACRPQKGAFRAQCEYVLWGSNGPLPVSEDSPCLPGVVRLYQPGGEKVHIAGKPLGLLRQLLPIVPKGSLVLDPFSGAGSVGMVCAEEGYRFIGFELDGYWVRRAEERREESGRHLFAGVGL